METKNVTNKVLALGDNEFEEGKITVAASTEIPAGALLKRNADGSFALAGGSDTAIAVMPFALKNEKTAAAVLGFRALVSGRVRLDMLNIGGIAITAAQRDALRDYGIIAVKATNVSELDNQ
ncbi:MAG: hypothetical protein LBC77_01220 [Spirochaetaceae bacterium]|nr:hypothetical protein [Spirochaetaceae bacterium]